MPKVNVEMTVCIPLYCLTFRTGLTFKVLRDRMPLAYAILEHPNEEAYPNKYDSLMLIDISKKERSNLVNGRVSELERLKKEYQKCLLEYNKEILDQVKAEHPNPDDINVIALPQSNREHMRLGIAQTFKEFYTSSAVVIVNKLELKESSSMDGIGMEQNFTISDVSKVGINKKPKIIILDDCVSTYATVKGVYNAFLNAGIQPSKSIAACYLICDKVKEDD